MKKAKINTVSPPDGKKKNRLALRLAAAGGIALVAVLLSLHVFAKPRQELPSMGATLTAASQGLDEITITAEFLPDQRQLTAQQTLRLQNRTGAVLPDVVLRTYANAFSSEEYSPAAIEDLYDQCYPNGFSAGSIAITQVLLGNESAAYSFDDAAKTVQRIALPAGWQPGEWIELALAYTITIPQSAYRFGYNAGIYTLGNVFPIPSIWGDGAWRGEEYFPLGDPFYSQCANYSVTVTAPKGYLCVGSAYGEKTERNGQWVYAFSAPAVREFALSISNQFSVAQEAVGDTLVTSYALSDKAAGKALKYGRQALACFNEVYGAYPYPHLAVAMVDFPFGGMEYPGLILVQKALYESESDQWLELVTAHEVAHQWWYAVVGSDQFYNPWQDEALADFALLDYTEKYYGKDARESLAFSRFETAMRVTIPRGVTPGSPIDYFSTLSEYSLVVYHRGAAMLVALQTALGDEVFYDFLRTYYREQAFRLASRQDFEETLKRVSGQDWGALVTDYLDTYIIN